MEHSGSLWTVVTMDSLWSIRNWSSATMALPYLLSVAICHMHTSIDGACSASSTASLHGTSSCTQ